MLDFVKANARWLAAGMMLTFTSSFGQTFFISIFSGEILSTFDLSHGSWGAIYAAGTFGSAIAMLWAGGLTDRFRVRALARFVLPFFAAACLAMALAPAGWMLIFIIFALRLAGQGMVSHIALVAMARWFVATRGRALSIAMLGFALGEALLPVTFVALLSVFDWRWLWVLAALMILAVMFPLERLLREERTPQSDIELNVSLGMNATHWSRPNVLRHWLFWLLIPVLLGPPAFGTAFFFHQVHFAETKGISHLVLVALFPLYTVCAVGASLISGIVVDRVGTSRLMPLYQLPMALGFALHAISGGSWGVASGLVAMALTVGMGHTVLGAFWAEFYGTRHLGAIKAMASAVMVLGTAIGPILTGMLIDTGMTFDSQMMGISLFFVIASAICGIGIARAAPLLSPAPQVDVIRP